MKISVYLKDPDGFYEGIEESVRNELKGIAGLSDRERDLLFDARRELVKEVLSRWVADGEYVGIDFDTEAKTATVVERKR